MELEPDLSSNPRMAVNSAEHVAQPLAQEPAPTASVGAVAHDTSEYVRAWSALLASETRLARVSLVRLGLAALIVPALALGICITLDAFLVTVLNRLLGDWSSCLAMVLLANLAGAYGLLVAMRRWWRNLSLPRSRGALAQLLERMG
jgi:hypothetical protein